MNNTNSSSTDAFKSPSLLPRSFGALKKSTLNSTSAAGQLSIQSNTTLPEAQYFASRRAADDFDRTVQDANLMDDYFGFDDDDDFDNNNGTLFEQSKSTSQSQSMPTANAGALDEIRKNLKRFLHNPDAESQTAKVSKKSPAKQPKRTPVKRNVVFTDAGAKQKDIRNAFTVQTKPKERNAIATTSDDTIALFDEVVPVCTVVDVYIQLFWLKTFSLFI